MLGLDTAADAGGRSGGGRGGAAGEQLPPQLQRLLAQAAAGLGAAARASGGAAGGVGPPAAVLSVEEELDVWAERAAAAAAEAGPEAATTSLPGARGVSAALERLRAPMRALDAGADGGAAADWEAAKEAAALAGDALCAAWPVRSGSGGGGNVNAWALPQPRAAQLLALLGGAFAAHCEARLTAVDLWAAPPRAAKGELIGALQLLEAWRAMVEGLMGDWALDPATAAAAAAAHHAAGAGDGSDDDGGGGGGRGRGGAAPAVAFRRWEGAPWQDTRAADLIERFDQIYGILEAAGELLALLAPSDEAATPAVRAALAPFAALRPHALVVGAPAAEAAWRGAVAESSARFASVEARGVARLREVLGISILPRLAAAAAAAAASAHGEEGAAAVAVPAALAELRGWAALLARPEVARALEPERRALVKHVSATRFSHAVFCPLPLAVGALVVMSSPLIHCPPPCLSYLCTHTHTHLHLDRRLPGDTPVRARRPPRRRRPHRRRRARPRGRRRRRRRRR